MSEDGIAPMVEAYLDGSLGDAERAALAQRLRADDEARAAFMRQVSLAQVMTASFEHDNAALVARIVAAVRQPPASTTAHTTRRLRRRPRRSTHAPIGVVAALAAAFALGVLAFWHFGQPSTLAADAAVRLAGVTDTRLLRADGGMIAGGNGMAVADGDQIDIGTQGAASLAWAHEDTAVTLAAGSSAKLERSAAGKRLRLDTGELSASVAPQPTGQPLIIITPQCSITVVGTRFTLASTPTLSRLRVAEGVVRMRASGAVEEVAVAAGQEAVASDGRATLAQTPPVTPTAPQTAPTALNAPASAAPFAGGTAAWRTVRGSWSLTDGVATLDATPSSTMIESRGDYHDFELTCRIHAVAGRTYAELQIHGNAFCVELLHTVDQHDWKEVRVVVRGGQVEASVNGSPQAADRNAQHQAASGPIGFFVGKEHALDIADLRIRPLDTH